MKMIRENKVKSRNMEFSQRPVSEIWQETASEENPYLAVSCRCHGYDLLDLMEKRSFVDVFFLLFQGELPTLAQASLLEQLMIALINPGPRHPATRAAMVTGASKTHPVHLLPLSLTILGGDHLGAGETELAMHFLQSRNGGCPQKVAEEVLDRHQRPSEGDWHPVPGFGSRFGGIDTLSGTIAARFAVMPGAGQALTWGKAFADALETCGMGWLSTGVAAAVFSDLGFAPKAGAGLYQILAAPGLLAHGLEFLEKPITAMPFPKDEDYVIESD